MSSTGRCRIVPPMSRIRTDMQFRVEKLWLLPESLGRAIEFDRDGWRVRVELPRDFADWYLLDGDKRNYPNGPFAGQRTGKVVPIVAIRVSVSREAPFGATDLESRSAEDGLTRYDREAHAQARAVVEELVGWARILKGQAWLGMSHVRPVQVGPRFTFDEDADQPIVYGMGKIVVEERSPSLAIGAADFDALAPLLSDGRPDLPLADVLIADGQHLLTLDKPNPSQAVLLAAIGSEIKVKGVLRTRADATQSPLVDFILGNPREVSLQAIGLFDQVMQLVIGRSLKTDDKGVFKSLDRLFVLRNAVAHRGVAVSIADARTAVSAAVAAAHWLDRL